MGYFDVLQSNLMLILVIIGLSIIVGLIFYMGVKAYHHAIEKGISKETMNRVIRSSAIYAIVPSIAIAIGLTALVSVLGNYWPWFRLSVIGSLAMELITANVAANSMGYSDLSSMAAANQASDAAIVMLVMSLAVQIGLIIQLFFGKKLQNGVMKIRNNKNTFSIIVIECFMMALMVVYLPDQIFKGCVATATLLTSAVFTVIQMLIIKKWNVKWLSNFVMTFSLIIGMCSSVLWSSLIE